MAARRLLVVMLVLLGVSTLAAALVPPRSLKDATSTGTTTTQPAPGPEPAPGTGGRSLMATMILGKGQIPVLAGRACKRDKPRCDPIEVGDQLALTVKSEKPVELEIPSFGLVAVANRNLPARFNLLFDEPGNVGIVYSDTHKVAARIEVLPAGSGEKKAKKEKKAAEKKGAKPEAPAESGQP